MTPQVRIGPDGYVAQRFPHDFNGHGSWLLTFWQAGVGLAVEALSDAAVADWPEMCCCAPRHADGSTCSNPDLSGGQ